jgi:hypothetical protein
VSPMLAVAVGIAAVPLGMAIKSGLKSFLLSDFMERYNVLESISIPIQDI